MTTSDAKLPTPDAAEEGIDSAEVQDGTLRAAIFGISDGLVTNVSLILGVVAADSSSDTIRLAGLAGMIAGAFSMAAGEFVSVSAQHELLDRQIQHEHALFKRGPARVRKQLTATFRKRGISEHLAQEMAQELTQDEDMAVETFARSALGIDPDHLGSPVRAALSSFVSFFIGALIPLLPWFVISGGTAIATSCLLGIGTATVVGWLIGTSTGRSPLRSAARQVLLGAVAGGFSALIGALLGVQGV
jgi:VIT1/CCC1 family predicted Fe2+/Mn2+ transporter